MVRREGDDLEELTRLMMAWIGLSMRITRSAESVKAMADVGLTMAQMHALHVLAFEGPRSVSELGAAMHHSLSATSHLVQRLVEDGLVSRAEAADDRRQKHVDLTAAGRKLMERLMRARQRELRAGLEHISSDTRGDLHRVMRRIVEELSARVAQNGDVPGAPSRESKDKDQETGP
jgi:DNA-binding MarR family transcriptional regulator